ncbi:SAM-dependent methyltransferase [Nonomuraea salmonea]|uniref:class I SAM-dependent methyltransferase n=1 Tax=Nonomuraea salmonea TaxID=46181 RepID=UPI002FED633E
MHHTVSAPLHRLILRAEDPASSKWPQVRPEGGAIGGDQRLHSGHAQRHRTVHRTVPALPATIGAVAPSSRRLAAAVCAPIPERGEPIVVELGPGTGAFTAEIQQRLDGRGHHLAVELNEQLARLLAERYPAVDVAHDDATRLGELLGERGLRMADVVVSGLPWAAFPDDVQRELLGAVTGGDEPGGGVHHVLLHPRDPAQLGAALPRAAGRAVRGGRAGPYGVAQHASRLRLPRPQAPLTTGLTTGLTADLRAWPRAGLKAGPTTCWNGRR